MRSADASDLDHVYTRQLFDKSCHTFRGLWVTSVADGRITMQELRRSKRSKVWTGFWCPWKIRPGTGHRVVKQWAAKPMHTCSWVNVIGDPNLNSTVMSCPPRRFVVFSISRLVRSSSHHTCAAREMAGLPERVGHLSGQYVASQCMPRRQCGSNCNRKAFADLRLPQHEDSQLWTRSCGTSGAGREGWPTAPTSPHLLADRRPQSVAAAAWRGTSRAARCDLQAPTAARIITTQCHATAA